MKSRDNRPPQPVPWERARPVLRQKAEMIARERESRSRQALDAISPEEARQKFHELLVHQIELEMQNNDLCRAQVELEESRARYADLYDLAPVGFCTISEQGLILEANFTAANLLDHTCGALMDQPFSRFIHKEDQDVFYLHIRHLFATGEPQDCELRMVKSGGESFWAHLAAITLTDAEGLPVCRTALSDITERRLKDEELKAIKDSLSSEIDALNNLHAISTQFMRQGSLQSIYEEILKAAIAMSRADKGSIQILDAQGQLRLFVHSGFGQSFLAHFENVSLCGAYDKAVAKKERVTVDAVSHTPLLAGTPDLKALLNEGIGSLQATPMINSAGKVLGVLSTCYAAGHPFIERELRMFDLLARQGADVLERARMEEALLQSEQRALALVEELRKADANKNEFISMLSHELRNPLAAIMAGVSLLELDAGAEKAGKTMEIIKRQSAQLCRLVDDLLDLTRININKIKLKMEHIELSRLVGAVAVDFEAQFEEKGVRLETDITGEPLFLDADPARLTQAVGNLLHNAAKFTNPGGAARLTVSRQEDRAVVCVEDNGIGIRPEILPDLFRPFVQLDHSMDRSNGGLGLGLAIVKGMVELHGGSVSAFSEGLGKGTRFAVSLPLCSREEDAPGANHPGGKPSGPLRILCIEDNTDFADVLCAMLGQLGHQTAVSPNGLSGIAKAKEFSPDIIFCDIGLPGISGYEVAKRIRSDPSLEKVFLVALTGYAGPKDVEFAVNSGFHKHMPKPVDMAALGQTLAEASSYREARGR